MFKRIQASLAGTPAREESSPRQEAKAKRDAILADREQSGLPWYGDDGYLAQRYTRATQRYAAGELDRPGLLNEFEKIRRDKILVEGGVRDEERFAAAEQSRAVRYYGLNSEFQIIPKYSMLDNILQSADFGHSRGLATMRSMGRMFADGIAHQASEIYSEAKRYAAYGPAGTMYGATTGFAKGMWNGAVGLYEGFKPAVTEMGNAFANPVNLSEKEFGEAFAGGIMSVIGVLGMLKGGIRAGKAGVTGVTRIAEGMGGEGIAMATPEGFVIAAIPQTAAVATDLAAVGVGMVKAGAPGITVAAMVGKGTGGPKRPGESSGPRRSQAVPTQSIIDQKVGSIVDGIGGSDNLWSLPEGLREITRDSSHRLILERDGTFTLHTAGKTRQNLRPGQTITIHDRKFTLPELPQSKPTRALQAVQPIEDIWKNPDLHGQIRKGVLVEQAKNGPCQFIAAANSAILALRRAGFTVSPQSMQKLAARAYESFKKYLPESDPRFGREFANANQYEMLEHVNKVLKEEKIDLELAQVEAAAVHYGKPSQPNLGFHRIDKFREGETFTTIAQDIPILDPSISVGHALSVVNVDLIGGTYRVTLVDQLTGRIFRDIDPVNLIDGQHGKIEFTHLHFTNSKGRHLMPANVAEQLESLNIERPPPADLPNPPNVLGGSGARKKVPRGTPDSHTPVSAVRTPVRPPKKPSPAPQPGNPVGRYVAGGIVAVALAYFGLTKGCDDEEE